MKRIHLVLPLFWLLFALQSALGNRVIEADAIPFTGFLSKADFDARYPGKTISNLTELDSGWYVIYEHEALQYFFGPITLESTGQDYLKQLEGVVAEAVAQRPSITGYTISLSYEPSQVTANSASGGNTGTSPAPSQSPDSGGSGNQSGGWGIFDFLRRIFGR
ncbi:MAG: hypothetical protein AAGH40_00190 [Verrucomicrobiota bacterium]